jgi:hypothetical protein
MGNLLRRLLLLTLIGCFLIAPGGWAGEGKQLDPGATYKKREILVKFKPGVSEAQIDEINGHMGTTVVKHMGAIRLLRIPETKTVEEMVREYNVLPEVEYAEPNYIYTIQN